MNTDYYKLWLKVNSNFTKHPVLEVWLGLLIWTCALVCAVGLCFKNHLTIGLILSIWSFFAVHYWGKLAILQWYHKKEQKNNDLSKQTM